MFLSKAERSIHEAVFSKLTSVSPFMKWGFDSETGLDISVPKSVWKTQYDTVLCDDTIKVERESAAGDLISVTPEEVERALDWEKAHAPGDKIETAFGAYRYVQCGGGGIGSGEVLGPDKQPFGISQECSDFFPAAVREGYYINGLPFGPQLTLEEMDKIYKGTEQIRNMCLKFKLLRILRYTVTNPDHFKLFMKNGPMNFDIVIR